MFHYINSRLASDKAVDVVVVGAGGTGSQVITALAQMQHALVALGHPGLEVLVIDDDVVSEANVGRQWFFPADVGHSKAAVLVQRVNLTMGTEWRAESVRLTASHRLNSPLVIGCVDTRIARFNIMRAMEEGTTDEKAYYLDFGNRQYSGQVVLGEVSKARRKTNPKDKLPHVGELFPEVMDPNVVDRDEGPSFARGRAAQAKPVHQPHAGGARDGHVVGAFPHRPDRLPRRVCEPQERANYGAAR